jgi:protein-tyrosine phosphatase
MVDIHCHMLPAVDDGAKSWEIAEEMARIALEDGITHVVCTPHSNNQYAYDRAAHQQRLQELRERTGAKMEFSLGCDFHFSFENLQEALQDPDKFLIGSTDYLLVEFSDYAMSPATGDTLLRLVSMGITPVITHPERNLILQRKPEHVLQFVQHGCIVQVTANSITGHWGDGPKRISKWLLDRQAVHVLASDAHDTRHRPPILSKARESVATTHGAELAEALVSGNPQAIVSGEELPYRPDVKL